MDNRIAMVSIIVENGDSVARLNDLLHEYSEFIIGRMGIPYREAGLNLISIAACAPVDRINALTGSLGRLPGVSAKAVYAPAKKYAAGDSAHKCGEAGAGERHMTNGQALSKAHEKRTS